MSKGFCESGKEDLDPPSEGQPSEDLRQLGSHLKDDKMEERELLKQTHIKVEVLGKSAMYRICLSIEDSYFLFDVVISFFIFE